MRMKLIMCAAACLTASIPFTAMAQPAPEELISLAAGELSEEKVETLSRCVALAQIDLAELEARAEERGGEAPPTIRKARDTAKEVTAIWEQALEEKLKPAAEETGADEKISALKADIEAWAAEIDHPENRDEKIATRRDCAAKVMQAISAVK
ncbi:hypothetical protein [Parvularcula marina]|uniref:hypothetical protein n=1 Tax=Parvularcula marina TaxID=2292771 RepID=UPI0035117D40